MTMASAARCVPALSRTTLALDARARTRPPRWFPKREWLFIGWSIGPGGFPRRRRAGRRGRARGTLATGVASHDRGSPVTVPASRWIRDGTPRRVRSSISGLRIEANNISIAPTLDCRVPSVTLASGSAAARDARNARDPGVAASPRPRVGEARSGALEGAPGDPPAAVAGATAPTTEHVCANASSCAARVRTNAPRGQSCFSEIGFCERLGISATLSRSTPTRR